MAITIHHMSVNIEGLLLRYKRKKINIFQNDDGSTASDSAARAYLAECQAKGWKLIPMSYDCEGFDHFGIGCPGHPIHTCEPHNGDFERFYQENPQLAPTN